MSVCSMSVKEKERWPGIAGSGREVGRKKERARRSQRKEELE